MILTSGAFLCGIAAAALASGGGKKPSLSQIWRRRRKSSFAYKSDLVVSDAVLGGVKEGEKTSPHSLPPLPSASPLLLSISVRGNMQNFA